ncbi:MAG: phenylalanine--tRNA ligase subunit alpha [Chitinivibrionales bacterium]|nr:phenylalanine--tRNA ligase subunit alpha [Chitinivibrionales bacterium]
MTASTEHTSPEDLEQIRRDALAQLQSVSDEASAEEFRIKYLGAKGIVKKIFKGMKSIAPEERKAFGARANTLRTVIEEAFKEAPWMQKSTGTAPHSFDPTLPGFPFPRGSLHPLMQIRNEIRDIFISMGFDVAHGPEVESDWYNFEALNFAPHHPARDMQDTFTISDNVVLRTHTSPVQIRVMEKQQPPVRCIMPGRVYRNEEVSARSYCLFHQVEGLYVDENVSFADLKGTLLAFARRFFDEKTHIKIRPSYFPFTEPSVEVDVECFLCKGAGCSVCKKSGWLEILGAGMVHPNVFASAGVDPEKYTGFAFGMGIERIAMLKCGIDDIRLFFENDVRFLNQF